MYNRYIRNDQGTYTRIPEEEPRHTQGGTSCQMEEPSAP